MGGKQQNYVVLKKITENQALIIQTLVSNNKNWFSLQSLGYEISYSDFTARAWNISNYGQRMILLKYALVLSVETLWLCTWDRRRRFPHMVKAFFPFVTYTQSKYFVSYRQRSFESCNCIHTSRYFSSCDISILVQICAETALVCINIRLFLGLLDWLWEHALLLLRDPIQ